MRLYYLINKLFVNIKYYSYSILGKILTIRKVVFTVSAFDRLQNYSAKVGLNESSDVFDVKTPKGAFLNRIHKEGFKMYDIVYKLKPEFIVPNNSLSEISEETYLGLAENERGRYDREVRYTELHNALTCEGNQTINAVAGSGKALVDGTRVYTEAGYKPIETLKVGDKVYGSDGKLHNVLGVFPQGKCAVYKVTFNDDTSIYCNKDHIWTLVSNDGTVRKDMTTLEIDEMMRELEHFNGDINKVPKLLPRIKPIEFEHPTKYNIDDCEKDVTKFLLHGYLPKDVIFASVADRLAFFKEFIRHFGLDYDEFLQEPVGITFRLKLSNSSFYKFNFFVQSLGFSASRDRNSILNVWRNTRELTDIEAYKDDEKYYKDMTCITIDSEDHLYLTEGLIPTHNTTALVFKIMYDIVTGEAMTMRSINGGTPVRVVNNMWVCTFLRSGAEELGDALARWQRKLGYSITASQVNFSTMDAEFRRCLNAMGVATPIGDASKLNSLMCKAIDSCGIQRKGYNLSKEDYQVIGGIITYYRGRLDQKRYEHPSCKDYDITPTILDLLVRQFANLRQQAGIMDFEEVMELLYKYLYITPNPAVQDFVANRYNYIYIDEFQDTSQMAYAILKFYARGHLWINRGGIPIEAQDSIPSGLYTSQETTGKLVVVGDVSQCVIEDTNILLSNNKYIPVDELSVGDKVLSCGGFGKLVEDTVTNIDVRLKSGEVYKLTTSNDKELICTPEHKVFVGGFSGKTEPYDIEYFTGGVDDVSLYMMGKEYIVNHDDIERYDSYEKAYERCMSILRTSDEYSAVCEYGLFESFPYDSDFYNEGLCDYMIDCGWVVSDVCDLSIGDKIGVADDSGVHLEEIKSIEKLNYLGKVFDISTEMNHNFITDGIINHNCIYSFRGSDSRILAEEVDNDFRPTISTLSVNWRCPENILNPVVDSIHMNSDSAKQEIKAANKGGEFFAYKFSTYRNMITQLKSDITKDMEDGLKVAVLCRTNFDGLIPAFVLAEDGRFDFSVSGENMTLNSPLPRKIIGVTSLFTERYSGSVKTSLEFFAGRGNQWAVKQLMDTLKLNNKSIWQIPIEDISYSCPSLESFITNVKKVFIDQHGNRDKSKELEALRVIYYYMITNVFDGDSAYCESARAYIETLLYILENNSFNSVYDFLDEIEFLNDKLNGKIKKKGVYIKIATVHEFKGKECDSVYVWNDSDGTFPSSKCDIGVEDQLNEERRVHYIACTRAKKREHIYALQSKRGMFTKEMNCEFVNPINPTTTLSKNTSI